MVFSPDFTSLKSKIEMLCWKGKMISAMYIQVVYSKDTSLNENDKASYRKEY